MPLEQQGENIARNISEEHLTQESPVFEGANSATTRVLDTGVPVSEPVVHATQTPSSIPEPKKVHTIAPPVRRSNRSFGVVVSVLATVVFAFFYSTVVSVLAAHLPVSTQGRSLEQLLREFIVRPEFYVPVIFFFLSFLLLTTLVNRGGWWAYIVGGFVVGAVVYVSFISASLLNVQAWNFTHDEGARFLAKQWFNPFAVTAGVIARELPVWFGAWLSARGRSVTAKNTAAVAEYEREKRELSLS